MVALRPKTPAKSGKRNLLRQVLVADLSVIDFIVAKRHSHGVGNAVKKLGIPMACMSVINEKSANERSMEGSQNPVQS